MGRQGRCLSDIQIRTIIRLLVSTDIQITEIAHRMGCSKASVALINRKSALRLYEGKRSSWKVAA